MDEVQPLDGGQVLLSGVAVLWFATAVERAAQNRVNGSPDVYATRWRSALVAAVRQTREHSSAIGTSELPIAASASSSVLLDPIDSSEAAAMLNVTPRWVTGQCRDRIFETSQMVGGRWRIERAEIAARAAQETC